MKDRGKMMKPSIRFNGFSDEWAEKKLGDVSNLIQGAAWKSSQYVESGSNLLITISNLKNAVVDTSFGNRLAEVSADLQEKYGIANNDLLVSMTGNVGRVSIYRDYVGAPNALLNQRVGKIMPVNVENLFLYAILHNELFERKMIDKGQGAAQLNISSKDIQQFPIQLPTLPEQQKIGTLFSKYDAIIALREQKLEELNALKKGMLQQMFDDGVATSHKPQATSKI